MLEIQTYPDLREYPEGPPEQPYDAAGWSLGHQMGVRVIEVTNPLTASVREALEPLSDPALSWDDPVEDASPFDIVPGVGFDDHPVARAIRPPPGRVSGSGGALHLDPAQNNAFRALNAAWDAGAQARFTEEAGGRFVVTGLDGQTARALTQDLALRVARGPSTGVPLRRPASDSIVPGRRAWTKDGQARKSMTRSNCSSSSIQVSTGPTWGRGASGQIC